MSFQIPDWLVYEIREKREWLSAKLLDVRGWLNRQNPRVIIGITFVTVLVLIIVVISLISGPEVPEVKEYTKAWFYDLNTGTLFVAKKGLIPPIEAPSGPLPDGSPAGIKAHVFTFTTEPNESERFIGFLETTDPNAEIEFDASGSRKIDSAASWGRGKLFRRVDDDKWVSGSSREGRAILEEALERNENGKLARYCQPK
jgi:hypothetical protein